MDWRILLCNNKSNIHNAYCIMFNIYIMLQSPCTAIKPAVIPKKRKFSNISLESIDSLDNNVSFPKKDTFTSVPIRCQTSESEISTEQTNEGMYLIQFIFIVYKKL